MRITWNVDQYPLAGGTYPPLVKHIEDDDLLQVAVEHTQLFGHHPGARQLLQLAGTTQLGH
ncbi:hypothetical protein D3C81_1782550 [compost metagenome]